MVSLLVTTFPQGNYDLKVIGSPSGPTIALLVKRECSTVFQVAKVSMECPNCHGQDLSPVMTRKGVEVDACKRCKGVWLDKGEIFHFCRSPWRMGKSLAAGRDHTTPTKKRSPRTGGEMLEFRYPDGPKVDLCPESEGYWFDAGELKQLIGLEKSFDVTMDDPEWSSSKSPPPRSTTEHEKPIEKASLTGVAALRPLPNLFVRSVGTLVGLYGLLTLFLISGSLVLDLPLGSALIGGVITSLFHFLLGPFLMDLWLRLTYRIKWGEVRDLPPHLVAFVTRLCDERGIGYPRFGVLDDGAPQAFTYGHTPGNARIVISRGLAELLEPEELESVVAHEIGHAVHWDMFLMTVAQLVPLVLYTVYRNLIRASRGDGKNKGNLAVVAMGAYALYMVSEYVVLWFSRTREYHADRFAGSVTGDPGHLASALVKIAYGLAGQEKKERQADENTIERSSNLDAIGALGIFDRTAATGMAIIGYDAAQGRAGKVDKASLKGAMRWDLWNPWAIWYELHSTHPLVAHRLLRLSEQAVSLGKKPFITFDERRPESYWDEFFVDFIIDALPVLAFFGVPIALLATVGGTQVDPNALFALMIGATGLASLVRYYFAYWGDFFPEMSVAALLKKVKVSNVRPVPCILTGTVIGRGVPGYIFSEDFIMRDETGIIFLDYRQPFAIWEFFFGLLKAGQYQGQEVVVRGWYRRAPVPYVELKQISWSGGTSKSWVPFFKQATGFVLVALAIAVWTVGPFEDVVFWMPPV